MLALMALVEVRLMVPEDRVEALYVLFGRWLEHPDAVQAGAAGPEGAEGVVSSASPQRRAGGKYEALGDLLARTREQGESSVELNVATLDAAVSGGLPASARSHRAWWANSAQSSQGRVWLEAGWRVDRVDLEQGVIGFVADRDGGDGGEGRGQ